MIGFIGILLGMFAMGVMQLVLATALPYIVAEIGGNNLYSWVFSSYMLASLVTIPIFSKLADIFGKKKFYMLGLGIFAAGTLYGGFVPNMNQLIIARIIQGLGGGIITPVSLAMTSDIFPEEKRGKMIGVFGFVQLLSNLLSPLLGNFITRQLGWHWIFFITVIMVLFALFMVNIGIKLPKATSNIKLTEIDVLGGILFGSFCVLVVGFLKLVTNNENFNVLGSLFIIAAIGMALLLSINEKHHKNPIIKIEFFKTKIIRRAIFNAIISGASMYGLVTILPLCGEALNKQGLVINGSQILFCFMIGITGGILVSSRFMIKISSIRITMILWASMCLCSIFILFLLGRWNLLMFNVLNLFMGICVGGIMSTFLISSQNAVNNEDRTVLSGLIQLGRYLGGSIGVTVLTGMLPEVKFISSLTQFWGVFGLLTGLSLIGLINEWF